MYWMWVKCLLSSQKIHIGTFHRRICMDALRADLLNSHLCKNTDMSDINKFANCYVKTFESVINWHVLLRTKTIVNRPYILVGLSLRSPCARSISSGRPSNYEMFLVMFPARPFYCVDNTLNNTYQPILLTILFRVQYLQCVFLNTSLNTWTNQCLSQRY